MATTTANIFACFVCIFFHSPPKKLSVSPLAPYNYDAGAATVFLQLFMGVRSV